MRHSVEQVIPGHPAGPARAEEGLGDVRVFWLAAAIAILAVVAVVAFKMNGRDVRAALFGNMSTWSQPARSQPSALTSSAGPERSFQLERTATQLAR